MNELRRRFLRRAGEFGALVAVVGTGALKPAKVLAAARNEGAFKAESIADALKALRITGVKNSTDIVIRAPDIAENGAVVPIDITSNIPGTKSISLFIDKNPFPYVGTFDVVEGGVPYVHVRVKMGKSSDVRVLVAAANSQYYQAAKEVKVTIGGCGG
ncbi:MAG: thiosulfate oxidation carrier protein SoxY [Betaproteobacteria bacterium]|nr:thiosulfate oxidation carrier protein SoxY [Betaproteobacteria bacterium]MDH3436126.1 thiosulfate oxidation carrier protein SoxY [Betaproteobacteria bacterium]